MIVITMIFACSESNKSDSGDNDTVESAWTIHTHPCVGNRTDAMWMDDANNILRHTG